MTRRFLLSEADRLTYRTWARAVAIVYAGVGLILFGLVALSEMDVMAPNQAAPRVVASTTASAARGTTQHTSCRGRLETCPGVPARE